MSKVCIIVAVGNYVAGKGYAIGKDGKLPWHNAADMKWFKDTTMGHTVIMGRKTYESIGSPLPGRLNLIVSSKQENKPYWFTSVEEAINKAKELNEEKDIFIIGGASIYKYVLDKNLADIVYIDYLAENVEGADAFFPVLSEMDNWVCDEPPIEVEKSKAYASKYYWSSENVVNNVDSQYLQLLEDILKNGTVKESRAGKVHSVFGRQMRFNLKEGLPMLTTKKMFSKGVIYELLWFLKGDTNIKYLVDNGVHIWDDDAYRYYKTLMAEQEKRNNGKLPTFKVVNLSNNNLTVEIDGILSKEDFLEGVKEEWIIFDNEEDPMFDYKFGDLNKVYGYQWTKWGGHNQIKEVIETLRTNPDDRRMIVSAWNIEDIPNMALPPCHYSCQFYTKLMTLEERRDWYLENCATDGMNLDDATHEFFDSVGVPSRKLSCLWNQRSCDTLLGVPFNILSYAILTHLIAQCVNMDVDELIFNGGDVHIYENQMEGCKEQLSRDPKRYSLPQIHINREITNIEDFTYDDIKILNYHSYPTIKMPLSVGL